MSIMGKISGPTVPIASTRVGELKLSIAFIIPGPQYIEKVFVKIGENTNNVVPCAVFHLNGDSFLSKVTLCNMDYHTIVNPIELNLTGEYRFLVVGELPGIAK